MEICHFSDIHGRLFLLEKPRASVKVIICSGDFFPNFDFIHEEKAQRRWFNTVDRHVGMAPCDFLEYIADHRPILWVAGNHDWEDLDTLMPRSAVYNLSKCFKVIEGKRFAGFRQVPRFNGRWKGEIDQDQFVPIVDKMLSQNPDILVTHCPPYGILDHDYGIHALTNALLYREHSIKHHFFGHVHEHGGQTEEQNGIVFHNNAENFRIVDV